MNSFDQQATSRLSALWTAVVMRHDCVARGGLALAVKKSLGMQHISAGYF